MATLFNPFFQVVDGDGAPIFGAKLYFYTTGTSTPQNTHAQSDLDPGSVNANPVVADADGRFGPIYLGGTDYKVILKTAADVTIETLDPLLVATNSVITAAGDLIIGNVNGDPSRLPIGVADRVLLSSGTTASWEQINLATSGVLTGILPRSKGGTSSAIAAPVVKTDLTFTNHATAAIPYDDTIPQVGEGVELLSQAYTAATAANRIRVTCGGYFSTATAPTNGILALFIDGAADAVRATTVIIGGFPSYMELTWEGTKSAGAHTYSIRGGTDAAGDLIVNGDAARKLGGVMALTLIIQELPTS